MWYVICKKCIKMSITCLSYYKNASVFLIDTFDICVRFKILSTNLIAVKMKPAEKSLLSSVSKSQKTVLLGNSVCSNALWKNWALCKKKKKMRKIWDQINPLWILFFPKCVKFATKSTHFEKKITKSVIKVYWYLFIIEAHNALWKKYV